MNGWMDGRMDGWMDGRIDGYTYAWMDKWMVDKHNMCVCTYIGTYICMNTTIWWINEYGRLTGHYLVLVYYIGTGNSGR